MEYSKLLLEGSHEGNTDAIYASIRENLNILEDIDQQPFANTPMHVAAGNGHTHFVVEMMGLKPSFARKLNREGLSPIHLALQNGHSQTAVRMVESDRELVRVKGRDGVTPLHYVARLGDPQLLEVFVSACPASLQDVTSRDKTAVHVALENIDKAVECVQVLLEGYTRFSQSGCAKIYLNRKDVRGDTPLHVATTTSQTRVVKALLDSKIVDLNETNSEGLTALNISEKPNGSEEIRAMLQSSAGDNAPLASHRRINMLDTFLSLEERLKAAARAGDTEILYYLIKEDPDLLDRIDAVPFVDTPLHIAASLQQISFAMEIMMLKPSFSRKLNQDGFTPLHLALQNQKDDMVFRMIDADKDLVRVQGRGGKTALHSAARHGNLVHLSLFLRTCPQSIQDVTTKRETVLHIAAKNYKTSAFDFLVANLRKSDYKQSGSQETEILNKWDENMDTALHVSVKTNQCQMVRVLLDCGVKTKLKNSQGLSPWDLSSETTTPENESARKAIRKMLSAAGASTDLVKCGCIILMSNASQTDVEGQTVEPNNKPSDYSWSKISILDRLVIFLSRIRANMSSDMRNMILVTMALIATATYQVVLAPPGGLWQDNNFNNTTATATANSTANNSSSATGDHIAGQAIFPFGPFYLINTTTLLLAIMIILHLLPGYSNMVLLCPLFLFFLCYGFGVSIILPLPPFFPQNFLLAAYMLFSSVPLFFTRVLLKVKRSLMKGIINKYMM